MSCLIKVGVLAAVTGLNLTERVLLRRMSMIALSLTLYPVRPSKYDPDTENILSIVFSFGSI